MTAPAIRRRGRLTELHPDRGYGFIQQDFQCGEDVFVLFAEIRGVPREAVRDGVRVTYEVVRDERTGRRRARNVRLEPEQESK